ncbi:MAG: DUF2634 domain-containing protein [Bacteroides sp.]
MAKGNQLYPVFDVPELVTTTAAEEQKYKPSVYFDYALGDFRRDGAGKIAVAEGHEAYAQWCVKVTMTERMEHLAYNSDIGTEMIDALSQVDTEAVKSAIERTITEALMVNKETEYVRDFEFTYAPSELRCEFTVKGKDWEEIRLAAYYKT